MAVSHQGVFVQTPKITPKSILPADTTAKVTICTAGSDGTKVVGITVTSTDTGTRILQIWLTRSATSYLLASYLIAIGAGTDGAISVFDAMNGVIWPGLPFDNDGQRYFFLESGDTLQASVTVAITAAKEIDITVVSGNF